MDILHVLRYLTETAVGDVEGGVVEALDVPVLHYMVDHSEGSGQPEEDADQDEDLGEEPHLPPADGLHHLYQRDLVPVLVVFRQLVLLVRKLRFHFRKSLSLP